MIQGIHSDDRSGHALSSLGDVNADGHTDFIIGAYVSYGINPQRPGQAYVLFGGVSLTSSKAFDLANLDGGNGFIIGGGAPGDSLGYSAGGAGDVNNDGIADIIVGAPATDSTAIGKTYVIFGDKHVGSGGFFNVSTLNGNNGFRIDGIKLDYSGYSVNGAGDVNNDGISDVVIGATRAPENGQAYVIYGRSLPLIPLTPPLVPLTTVPIALIAIWLLVGLVGAALITVFCAALFTAFLAKKRFDHIFKIPQKDSDIIEQVAHRNEVLYPIAKQIYSAIKVSGFLGYISQEGMQAYIDAIESILIEIRQQDINFEDRFKTASAKERHRITGKIADQIKRILLTPSCCRLPQFCLFRPQVSSEAIKNQAKDIADTVNETQPLLEVAAPAPEIQSGLIQ